MRKKLFWATNMGVLSLFTLYGVGVLFGIGTERAYAQTLSEDGFYESGDGFVVVEPEGSSVAARVRGNQEICSLNSTQVAQLDAFFDVDTFDIEVEETDVTIASVSGRHLTKQQLMDYLRASDESLRCKVIQHHRVFFLPVIPGVS